MWSDLSFDPSFKVKLGQSHLKVNITRLLLVLEICDVKPSYRKSWAANLHMWLYLPLAPPSRSNEDSQTLKCLSLT